MLLHMAIYHFEHKVQFTHVFLSLQKTEVVFHYKLVINAISLALTKTNFLDNSIERAKGLRGIL